MALHVDLVCRRSTRLPRPRARFHFVLALQSVRVFVAVERAPNTPARRSSAEAGVDRLLDGGDWRVDLLDGLPLEGLLADRVLRLLCGRSLDLLRLLRLSDGHDSRLPTPEESVSSK